MIFRRIKVDNDVETSLLPRFVLTFCHAILGVERNAREQGKQTLNWLLICFIKQVLIVMPENAAFSRV
jgi:hypothetical protein